MSALEDDLRSLLLTEHIFQNIKFFVSGEVEDKLIDLLKCGGAERMNYFSDYVTHLICGTEAEETDVLDANDLYEIPAVTPKWIIMCVKLRKLVNTKPYHFATNKLFSNLMFSFSNIEEPDRSALWSIITYYGGKVVLNFNKYCTHLITTCTNSSKYLKAITVNVEIATPDWIIESVKNRSLVQIDLFHPKLIIQKKAIKYESTTSITGFEPEQEQEDRANNTAQSTQALLEQLKQRMPWNQPVTTKDAPPPNVVAPRFPSSRIPQQNLQQVQQQRMFAQQLMQSPQNSFGTPQTGVAKTIVHHPPQGTLINQMKSQVGQFSQANQLQIMQNRVHQQLAQPRGVVPQLVQQQQQANKGPLLNQVGQQTQFANQQLLQRTQMGQIAGQMTPGQVVVSQPQPQQAPQINQMVGQNPTLVQRAQIGKTAANLQQLQQQLANRQQLNQTLNQQQQFVNLPQHQQPLIGQNTQNSAFVNVSQQLGQALGQNQLQQLNLQRQQTTVTPELQQQFVNSSPIPQQAQHQFSQNQQFAQPNQQQFGQANQTQIVQSQFTPNQFGQQQLINQQQISINQQQQPPQQRQLIGQVQIANSQLGGQQLVNQVQMGQMQQQLITQQQVQAVNQQSQINKSLLLNPQQPSQQMQVVQSQQQQQNQVNVPKPVWQQQQQQQQQLGIRHNAGIVQQQQQPGPRIQWSPTQQQPGIVPQRQFIHLDTQTHQQLQQMGPEQRALFIAKIQKQRQLLLQQRQLQMQQQQQQRAVLIRSGPVPQGLNPQQQVQWIQQQAKQVMIAQPNVQQPNQVIQNPGINSTLQHAPGLSPIQQPNPQFSDQSQLQIQRQQFRLQQLQLQMEQGQKVNPQLIAQPSVAKPIGQPQIAENPSAIVDSSISQQQLVVNPKTKTALANMLSIRLQSGGSTMGTPAETLAEPSAAGTLRLMTAQHNAALNSNNRNPDLVGLQQRRSGSNGDLIRPTQIPTTPSPVQQAEPPKLQYSPRNTIPVQHRQGPYYGHNPNLKLPPDFFLLGCVFTVVEVERFLEETYPDWQQIIERHGGEIEKNYCNRVTHILCETQRHGVVMQALRDCKRCVTLYWLSDVCKRKQVLPPWIALHLPIMYLDTTPASKHLISLTGFEDCERNRIKDMIKYIGATFTGYFSKHNTLLIAAKSDGSKFTHAKKWGTPIVNVQWLTDVMLGNFTAFNQMEHIKYQQYISPPIFNFEPSLVPNLMLAWKMPINISQDCYEKVKRSASPSVLSKNAKKPKLEIKNDENESPNDQTPYSATHRILFSSCLIKDELGKVVKHLGGSIAKSHLDCTHLVMSSLVRNHKLLLCICLGVQILPESWLRNSYAANTFLDPSNFCLDTKEFNREYKCDFNQTLVTRNRNKLFEGKFFYITPSVFPSKNLLVEIIKSCGGIVEKKRRTVSQIEATNMNSPYSYIILTHENDLHLVYDVLKHKKDKIPTVCNVELIYSAILKQTFEVEPYAVQVEISR